MLMQILLCLTCRAAPCASSNEQIWPSCAGDGTCCSCAHAVRACESASACSVLALAPEGSAALHPRTESCAGRHTSHSLFSNCWNQTLRGAPVPHMSAYERVCT
jgi:hypothetical protein